MPDSFQKFAKAARENGALLLAIATILISVSGAAAVAQNTIANQGKRLDTLEKTAGEHAVWIATVDQRSKQTLDTVNRVEGKVDELLKERRQ